MGANSSSTKTRIFQLRNDESLDIPISFDEDFIKKLTQNETTRGRIEAADLVTEALPGKDLQKRLIWESRSVTQTDMELKALAERISKNTNPDTVPFSEEAHEIKKKLIACYKESPSRILDCPALSQFLDLEKSVLDQYINL